MVQAAPNESVATGTLGVARPDPERPGFVIVELEVQQAASTHGERELTPHEDHRLELHLRADLLEGIDEGAPVTATIRMAGPALWLAQSLERVEPDP